MNILRIITHTTVSQGGEQYIARESHSIAGASRQWYKINRAKDGRPYKTDADPGTTAQLNAEFDALSRQDPEPPAPKIITPDHPDHPGFDARKRLN